ncbi:peptide deformylase [Dactylosporangium matsuzakiense]|uniref:Peptide deformylase n=1 Tax=Dactylosporangium matsuzakiense TaxID=53360 RepID=A0A9W6NT80_9ACTN|nr:peptide deformylase [Dactylosporangium matsuzakiense]UWZ48988.1 peptide deformylase [Dactylosporangium matsuzakiense]GLL08444.1 peptide deformylase [Dactylosporangium matsuzakiense]
MSAQIIRRYGDPVLRRPAPAVTVFDAALHALVADLFDTLDAAPGRAGLAAPQVGVAARVFVYATAQGRGHVVNPQVTARAGVQTGDEACLSLPGLAFPTSRAQTVTVTGADQHGDPVTVTGSGFLARALQHETDHCDGVLFVDTLTGDPRRQALRAVRALFRPGS